MKYLTNNEIHSCARGISQSQETAAGVELYRFSTTALEVYRKQEGWEVRSRCSAGVVLDFFTDSNYLYLKAQLSAGARETAYYDLYINDIFTGTIGSTCPDEILSGEFHWQSSGVMRVTLYLPHCRTSAIQQLAIADNTSFSPAPLPRTLLAMGDSITQGMEAHHPSLNYPAVAARALGMLLYNCGVGGYIFDAASLPEAPMENPSLITVAYGTNGWSAGRKVTYAREYLSRLRELFPAVPVAVLEPIWRSSSDDDSQTADVTTYSLADYRRELATIIEEFPGMFRIPMSKLLPPGNSFLCDGTHPDSCGHIVFGNNLAKLLQQVVPAISANGL